MNRFMTMLRRMPALLGTAIMLNTGCVFDREPAPAADGSAKAAAPEGARPAAVLEKSKDSEKFEKTTMADSTRKSQFGVQPEMLALYPPLAAYVAARQAEYDRIPDARREDLEELSGFIREQRAAERPVRLTFVCTHNSRRSHMAQLWAAAAAEAYGLRVATFSGGTEATAFNPRAVAALQRAGLNIAASDPSTAGGPTTNPRYLARLGHEFPPLECFSKRYDAEPNPRSDFAAVMVCNEADKACPLVPGAAARFALPFVDPKVSDDTPAESATYDERCAQIAREMLYVMSRAASRNESINRP